MQKHRAIILDKKTEKCRAYLTELRINVIFSRFAATLYELSAVLEE